MRHVARWIVVLPENRKPKTENRNNDRDVQVAMKHLVFAIDSRSITQKPFTIYDLAVGFHVDAADPSIHLSNVDPSIYRAWK